MDYPEKVFITLFLSPKRYNLLNDIINYTFSGVFYFKQIYFFNTGSQVIFTPSFLKIFWSTSLSITVQ